MQNEEQKAEQLTEAGMAQSPMLDEVPTNWKLKFTLETDFNSLARLLKCLKEHDTELWLKFSEQFNKAVDELNAR